MNALTIRARLLRASRLEFTLRRPVGNDHRDRRFFHLIVAFWGVAIVRGEFAHPRETMEETRLWGAAGGQIATLLLNPPD